MPIWWTVSGETWDFPGAAGAMVERETVDIATGEVSRHQRSRLTSLGSGQCGPRGSLNLFRDHRTIENSHHHGSFAAGMRTSTPCPARCGRGVRHLGQHWTEHPVPPRMVSYPDVHTPASQMLRLPADADHRPSLRTNFLTLRPSCRFRSRGGLLCSG